MYCRACNSIVPQRRFCPFCGTRLPHPDVATGHPERTQPLEAAPGAFPCPICRKPVLPDYAFCPDCGERTSAGPRPTLQPAIAARPPQPRPISEADKARIDQILGAAARLKARKQYSDALFSARSALAIDPDCADTHAMIGEIHHAAGSLEDAIVEYTNAVDLDPNRPGFRDRLGRLEEEHKLRGEELANVMYEHEGDIATIFRVFFTRSHPKWYKRGWFNAGLFVVLFVLTIYLIAFCTFAMWIGPLWLRTLLFSAMIVTSAWIFYDAQANDKPGILWLVVNLICWAAGFSFLGIIIYIIFRL